MSQGSVATDIHAKYDLLGSCRILYSVQRAISPGILRAPYIRMIIKMTIWTENIWLSAVSTFDRLWGLDNLIISQQVCPLPVIPSKQSFSYLQILRADHMNTVQLFHGSATNRTMTKLVILYSVASSESAGESTTQGM